MQVYCITWLKDYLGSLENTRITYVSDTFIAYKTGLAEMLLLNSLCGPLPYFVFIGFLPLACYFCAWKIHCSVYPKAMTVLAQSRNGPAVTGASWYCLLAAPSRKDTVLPVGGWEWGHLGSIQTSCSTVPYCLFEQDIFVTPASLRWRQKLKLSGCYCPSLGSCINSIDS